MSTELRRIRRTPEAARDGALDAAQRLLLAGGPGSVTLKAVAAELGMSHANIIHHFGSAAGLQTMLMERMIRDTVAGVRGAVDRLRAGDADPRDIVDLVFDSFARRGVGQLTAWLIATGEAARLRPLFQVVRDLVTSIEAGAPHPPQEAHRRITDATLMLVLTGLGDALIGPMLHVTLERSPDTARQLTSETLLRLIAQPG
jgi:AcrR family transcriptional regulator